MIHHSRPSSRLVRERDKHHTAHVYDSLMIVSTPAPRHQPMPQTQTQTNQTSNTLNQTTSNTTSTTAVTTTTNTNSSSSSHVQTSQKATTEHPVSEANNKYSYLPPILLHAHRGRYFEELYAQSVHNKPPSTAPMHISSAIRPSMSDSKRKHIDRIHEGHFSVYDHHGFYRGSNRSKSSMSSRSEPKISLHKKNSLDRIETKSASQQQQATTATSMDDQKMDDLTGWGSEMDSDYKSNESEFIDFVGHYLRSLCKKSPKRSDTYLVDSISPNGSRTESSICSSEEDR